MKNKHTFKRCKVLANLVKDFTSFIGLKHHRLPGFSGPVQDPVPADPGTLPHVIEVLQAGEGLRQDHLDLVDLAAVAAARQQADAVSQKGDLLDGHRLCPKGQNVPDAV